MRGSAISAIVLPRLWLAPFHLPDNRNPQKENPMDPIPGWKTRITAILTALFNIAGGIGWVDASPETVTAINGGLLAAIGLFLAQKIDRGNG